MAEPRAPIHGERDEEHQFGVTIPSHGWTLDADNFLTRATSFFDHNNFNDSEIFIPITIEGARINGWELTLHSRAFTTSAMFILRIPTSSLLAAAGSTVASPIFLLAAAAVFSTTINATRCTSVANSRCRGTFPWPQTYPTLRASRNGDGTPMAPGDHLQPHTTFDLSFSRSFGERFSANVQVLNVADRRVLSTTASPSVARITSIRVKYSSNCATASATDWLRLCGFHGIVSSPIPAGRDRVRSRLFD